MLLLILFGLFIDMVNFMYLFVVIILGIFDVVSVIGELLILMKVGWDLIMLILFDIIMVILILLLKIVL